MIMSSVCHLSVTFVIWDKTVRRSVIVTIMAPQIRFPRSDIARLTNLFIIIIIND